MSGSFDIAEEPVTTEADADLAQVQADPNASPFKKFINKVRLRGRESARGKDSLPNLVGDTALAVSNGAFDPKAKEKHPKTGEEISMAAFIFYNYAAEEGKKAIHDRTKGSIKSQVSKIQQVITAAAKPNASFAGALDHALKTVKPRLEAAGRADDLKPAFDAYISMARAQKGKDNLDDADIEKAWLKPAGHENSIEKELAKMHKKLVVMLTKGTKDGLKIETSDDVFEDLEGVAHTLKSVIRTYNSDYEVPKQKKTPPNKAINGGSEEEAQDAVADADTENNAGEVVATTDTPPVTPTPDEAQSAPVQSFFDPTAAQGLTEPNS